MIKFIAVLPFFILMRLVTFPLAPIAVAFQKDYKLRWPFKWMDTIDNDLRGDEGWQSEHCQGYDVGSYCCMVKWMWRNGGNWASYYTFGMPRDTYWFWSVKVTPGLQWRLGWNPLDFKQDRSKFNFTVRYRP